MSDAQGRFTFRDNLPGMYIQLAYWGPNAPKSRSLAFAKTRPGMGQTVTIDVPEPATVSGSFDGTTFPDSGSSPLLEKTTPSSAIDPSSPPDRPNSDSKRTPRQLLVVRRAQA